MSSSEWREGGSTWHLAEKLRKASRWKQDIFGGLGQAWERLGSAAAEQTPAGLVPEHLDSFFFFSLSLGDRFNLRTDKDRLSDGGNVRQRRN
jgi:hypothetical protein